MKFAIIVFLGALGYLCYRNLTDSSQEAFLFTWPNTLYVAWLLCIMLCLYAIGSKRRAAMQSHSRERRKKALADRKLKQMPASSLMQGRRSMWSRNDRDAVLLPSLCLLTCAAALVPLFFKDLNGSATEWPVVSQVPMRHAPVTNTSTSNAEGVSAPPAAEARSKAQEGRDTSRVISLPPEYDQPVPLLGSTVEEVTTALDRWRTATISTEPAELANCFAQQVEHY